MRTARLQEDGKAHQSCALSFFHNKIEESFPKKGSRKYFLKRKDYKINKIVRFLEQSLSFFPFIKLEIPYQCYMPLSSARNLSGLLV